MTQFFAQQDKARKQTRLLVIAMGMAILSIAGVFYFFLAARERLHNYESTTWWYPKVFALSFGGTLLVVLGASLVRSWTLRRGGGRAIAEMLGGRLVSGQSQEPLERRLVNVVEEMSIASGTPMPAVYILDEPGINAFAAGYTLDEAVIAVTQGALDALTRDELQGVIAHEFSHILNGDMRINIRLMGIIFGILCISLIGQFLCRSAPFAMRRRSSGNNSNQLAAMLALLALGVAMIAIGWVGRFFARIIKAAISRQREFLADASAVQFTRNRDGITGALKKIAGWPTGSAIQANRSEEASHLFFGPIALSRLFATHPPLEERIRRLDPSSAAEIPPTTEISASINNPEEIVSRIGQVNAVDPQWSHNLIQELPEGLHQATQHPLSAVALVYGLLLDADPSVRNTQLALIPEDGDAKVTSEVQRLYPGLLKLSNKAQLPLVEMACGSLCQLSPAQKTSFVNTVDALVQADQHISLSEYLLAHTLKRRLNPDRGKKRVFSNTLKLHRAQHACHTLLSALVHAGNANATQTAQAYQAGYAILNNHMNLNTQPKKLSFDELGTALEQMQQLNIRHRQIIVDACAATILSDAKVTQEEAELLRIICDNLDCPLPPLSLQ